MDGPKAESLSQLGLAPGSGVGARRAPAGGNAAAQGVLGGPAGLGNVWSSCPQLAEGHQRCKLPKQDTNKKVSFLQLLCEIPNKPTV